jgi:hypothetical protein
MSTLVAETDRILTLNLPEQLAQQVEAVARQQKTDVNELVQWAIRVYLYHNERIASELNEPIDPSNPESMTLAEVSDFIKQSRREDERRGA